MSQNPPQPPPKPTTGKTVEASHKGEAKTTLKFDENTFKMTFDVKGFTRENIHVQQEGRKITINCHQVQQHHTGPPKTASNTNVLSGTVKDLRPGSAPVKSVAYEDEIIDRTIRQIGTIPDGVDLKTIKIDVDTKNGVIVVTGKALPPLSPTTTG